MVYVRAFLCIFFLNSRKNFGSLVSRDYKGKIFQQNKGKNIKMLSSNLECSSDPKKNLRLFSNVIREKETLTFDSGSKGYFIFFKKKMIL